jgi:hypothetical protein
MVLVFLMDPGIYFQSRELSRKHVVSCPALSTMMKNIPFLTGDLFQIREQVGRQMRIPVS